MPENSLVDLDHFRTVVEYIEGKLNAALDDEALEEGKEKALEALLRELADPPVKDPLVKRVNIYTRPEATGFGGAKKLEGPLEILEGMLLDRGRTAFAMSHNIAQAQRGWVRLPDSLRELHGEAFVRLALEMFAGFRVPSGRLHRDLPLNVLLVDNKPEEILDYNELLPPELGFLFWRKCAYWILKIQSEDDCNRLRDWIRDPRGNTITLSRWLPEDGLDTGKEPSPGEIDLVLQDEFLGQESDGLALADAYFEHMPQALVFLTTGLDISNLTALRQSRSIDRIVPKNRLAALPWYYYLAFSQVLGSMFWEPWLEAQEIGKTPFLERRSTLRNLFGTIRRWQREPEILWHGQALAEMVDHGHEHISDLWRLTQEILGARNGAGKLLLGDEISLAERVLVALGIWLHDVGHRGDDHSTDPATIRDVHGSISERLILQQPEAFGLGWLCTEERAQSYLRKRNWLPAKKQRVGNGSRQIHPLRLAGLLCRHHQSSAPLFRSGLAPLHFALKFPSDYALDPCEEGSPAASSMRDSLERWRDEEDDLEWRGFEIRALEDFADKVSDLDLMKCGCLLRMIDALHLIRKRAGSPARLATHRLYRDNRRAWADTRLKGLRRELSRASVSSPGYLAALGEMSRLERYRELLEIQDVHLWRQACVQAIEVIPPKKGSDCVEVNYRLAPSGFWTKKEFREFQRALMRHYYGQNNKFSWIYAALPQDPEAATWAANFIDDCIDSEVQGQKKEGHDTTYLARFVFDSLDLRFSLTGAQGGQLPLYSLKMGPIKTKP